MPTAKINDIDIYYEEHGDAAAEPVLLIMGFVTNAAAWAPQIPALAERYRVIAFDNRGAGRTSQPEGPYTIAQLAEDARALLDHLGIASAHVVGASMGGMIAQELALRYPSRVRSLVLACTTPGGPQSVGHELIVDAVRQAREIEDLSAVWTPERVQEFALLLFTPEFLAHPGPEFAQYVAGVMQHPSSLVGLKGQMEAVLAHDTFGRLGDITAPTLVIAGADDTLVDAGNSPILAERIPHAELRMLAGLRHGFTAERPGEVNDAFLTFLARVSSQSSVVSSQS